MLYLCKLIGTEERWCSEKDAVEIKTVVVGRKWCWTGVSSAGIMTFHSSHSCGFQSYKHRHHSSSSRTGGLRGGSWPKEQGALCEESSSSSKQTAATWGAVGRKAVPGQTPTGCDFVSAVALWFKSTWLCDSLGPVPVTCSQLHLLYIMVLITANIFRSKGMPTPPPEMLTLGNFHSS